MSYHNRCEKCRIRKDYCVCHVMPSVVTRTFITLIPHIKEYWLPSTTSFITKQMAPNSSEILIRGQKDKPLDLQKELKLRAKPLVLYPSEDSIEITPKWIEDNNGPFHLIVPDGTWSQTSKVLKREAVLQEFTKVRINPSYHSGYKLRTSPDKKKICTLEAILDCLEIIGEKKEASKMRDFFKLWVDVNHKLRSKSTHLIEIPESI